MNTDPDMTTILQWDSTIKVGDPAIVRWSHCGHYYSVTGKITKINQMTARVAIDKDQQCWTSTGEVWFAGTEILAPRPISLRAWTFSNGILPITPASTECLCPVAPNTPAPNPISNPDIAAALDQFMRNPPEIRRAILELVNDSTPAPIDISPAKRDER